jgi:hypothetical protein
MGLYSLLEKVMVKGKRVGKPRRREETLCAAAKKESHARLGSHASRPVKRVDSVALEFNSFEADLEQHLEDRDLGDRDQRRGQR